MPRRPPARRAAPEDRRKRPDRRKGDDRRQFPRPEGRRRGGGSRASDPKDA